MTGFQQFLGFCTTTMISVLKCGLESSSFQYYSVFIFKNYLKMNIQTISD